MFCHVGKHLEGAGPYNVLEVPNRPFFNGGVENPTGKKGIKFLLCEYEILSKNGARIELRACYLGEKSSTSSMIM